MNGRIILAIVGALGAGVLLGYVLGGIGPRSEVEKRNVRIAELEEESRSNRGNRSGWRSPVPGLDRILREPEPVEGSTEVVRDPMQVNPDGGAGAQPFGERLRDRIQRTPAEQRFSAFERAMTIQNVRRVQSRAALAEQANLSDEELEQVDVVLGTLNEELVGHGEELIFLAMSGEPPPARDLLGITHDVTGILHRAQLDLERILGEDRASEIEPSAMEVWNHVDLGRLEPAARTALGRVQ